MYGYSRKQMTPHQTGFYSVKIASIFIISIFYFVVGALLSTLLNDFIPDENLQDMSTLSLMTLLGVIFGSIGVVFYALRHVIKRMPFFLDGYYGFKYYLLREAAGGLIVAYVMYAYLDKLKNLMVELGNRLRDGKQDLLRSTI